MMISIALLPRAACAVQQCADSVRIVMEDDIREKSERKVTYSHTIIGVYSHPFYMYLWLEVARVNTVA
jgi:hypothetical protein